MLERAGFKDYIFCIIGLNMNIEDILKIKILKRKIGSVEYITRIYLGNWEDCNRWCTKYDIIPDMRLFIWR